MTRNSIILLGALFLIGGLLLAGNGKAQEVTAVGKFQPHSLIGASNQDIGKAALDYTWANFQILSGNPQILLVRPVTISELPALGLPNIGESCLGPPLALVILHGDFDVSNIPGSFDRSASNTHVAYIGYVFDLRVGAPTLTDTSRNGGFFRIALNDPTLPDDSTLPPLNQTPAGISIAGPTLAPAPLQPCEYDVAAPTAFPPQ